MIEIVSVLLISLILSLFFGTIWLRLGRIWGFTEKVFSRPNIRLTALRASYDSKRNTVTMGGIGILLSIFITSIFWVEFNVEMILLFLSVFLFGFVAFTDDYIKHNFHKISNNSLLFKIKGGEGMRMRYRLLFQIAIASILSIYIYLNPIFPNLINIPFINLQLNFGLLYIPLLIALILGTVNAVNITDGLDGLAAGTVITATTAITLINLQLNNMNAVYFGTALIGACLGFLLFNFHPAKMFMGDIGASSLGAGLAILVILSRQKLLFVIIGGVLVIEAGSSIIQCISIKLFNFKILPMAPLHHTFQKWRWPELKIVLTFWTISLSFALMGLLIFLK